MKTGKDVVVIGKLPDGSEVGDRSVVITATDESGNVVLTTPGAYGYAASAGKGTVAVGAFANAEGGQLLFPDAIKPHLDALVALAADRQQMDVFLALQQISNELQKPAPEPGVVHKAWAAIQQLATIDGAHSLLTKATVALFAYLQG